jgi:hypothetical protein
VTEPNQRSVPYFCPYCGGEDLRPYEPAPDAVNATSDAPNPTSDAPNPTSDAPNPTSGDLARSRAGWECRECTRVFSVTFLGLVVRQ